MIANAVAKAEDLTGLKKAAMLLILLGDKISGELLKQFEEDEIQLVSREVARSNPSRLNRRKLFSKSSTR